MKSWGHACGWGGLPLHTWTSEKNRRVQATFGNLDHSYRQILVSKGKWVLIYIMDFASVLGVAWVYASSKNIADFLKERQEKQQSLAYVQCLYVAMTTVTPSHSEESMGWSQECLRPDFGHDVLRRSAYAMCPSGSKFLSCEGVCLKSKPPLAQWLLWFQQKAADFLRIRNKRGTVPRTHGSFSVLPQRGRDHLLLRWACL